MAPRFETAGHILKWERNTAGYEIRHLSDVESEAYRVSGNRRQALHVIGKASGEIYRYQCHLSDSDILIRFVNSPPTDAGLLEFASHFGLPANRKFQPLSSFLLLRKKFGRLFDMQKTKPTFDDVMNHFGVADWPGYGFVGAATAGLMFEPASGKESQPKFYWSARTLADFMAFETLTLAGGPSMVGLCDCCGKWYMRPTTQGPEAVYCSNACKQRQYRERKKLASPVGEANDGT